MKWKWILRRNELYERRKRVLDKRELELKLPSVSKYSVTLSLCLTIQSLAEYCRRESRDGASGRKGLTRRFTFFFRCNNDAQLFHHVEWLPGDAARRFEPDCHERVGRRVHVLHLRESSRVRLRELRRPQAADAQRCLSSGREPRHPGTTLPIDVSS